MKRWLICLLTYNRPRMLDNAARSIDAFFPWGDRLVIDDGSDDPQVLAYLQKLSQKPQWKCKIMERLPFGDFGSFYKNLKFALDYALKEGYDYCFIFEDNAQFVWLKENYPDYIDNVFSNCPDAIQIFPLFPLRANFVVQEYIQSARAYRTERGYNSSAIWNLSAVRGHPDYSIICSFKGSNLALNSAYWLRRGYRLYYQYDPTVAKIPWKKPESKESAGEEFKKRGLGDEDDFILRPLNKAEVDFLQHHPPSTLVYQDYFNLSNEYPDRPIYHRHKDLNTYYMICRDVVERENKAGASPVTVPVLENWEPTEIPPLQNHLNWKATESPAWRQFIRRHVPPYFRMRKLRNFMLEWSRFRLRDYLGYLELKKRLKKEKEGLPF